MSWRRFARRQHTHIRKGGWPELRRKFALAARLRLPYRAHLFPLAIPLVLLMRVMRPFLLVRLGRLRSAHIGDFAADTEMYLCERDANINLPARRHVDLFFMDYRISNRQLALMWRRHLTIYPAIVLAPIEFANRLLPGGSIHEIGHNTSYDRDVYNLLDQTGPHLQFTEEEEQLGREGLRKLGIPEGVPFVCLNARDSAYYASIGLPTKPSSFRDTNIQNFVMAAEELADLGYYVIRMGAKAGTPLHTQHPRVVDYAGNGLRDEFMDIYLAGRCAFCVSSGTGFDSLPYAMRRPIVYVSFVPIGNLPTFSEKFLIIPKGHFSRDKGRLLSLREIYRHGVAAHTSSDTYEQKGVVLIESTPEEIRDAVVEMHQRLNGSWIPDDSDDALQQRFREVLPVHEPGANPGHPNHGEIRARIGAAFLRKNACWLE